MAFVELHARSAFSFLLGASQPETLVRRAADLGLGALGLCDRAGVYGSARAHLAARACGLRVLVGAELPLEDGSHLPVLVETLEGYRNLCRLLTQAHLRESHRLPAGMGDPGASATGRPCVRLDELQANAAGLIALGGDECGPLYLSWKAGGPSALERCVEHLQRCFPGDRLHLLIRRQRIRGEERWNRVLQTLAEARRLMLVASASPLQAIADEREVLDVFTCLRHHTRLDAAGRLLSRNAGRHLQGEAGMRELFPDLPEAVDASGRLAERIEFSLENPGYSFPSYPVPSGESMDSFLAKLTWFGAEQRYGGLTPAVRSQLRHELDLIQRLGFSGYFLVVWDIVNFAREQGILVQGRGSAANSAVCYSLGITAVDPVGQGLLFERFLSEGRKGWPDIDLDLPSGADRERVIQEVYRRHGPRGAGMTANVITYRSRSAAREIAKVLDLPDDVAARFSRLFARGDYPHTLDLQDQMHRAGLERSHPRAEAFVRLHGALRGLPRHIGQHSGGMVICQGALDSVVPLQPASMPGRVVVQWDKDDCEDLGIVKVDLLGLGMMAVLQECLETTRRRGRPVDLARLPKDDPATFDLLCKADTIGTFQVESRAQQATLPRMQPRVFYDLVVEVAIIRPGPVQGGLVHPYLERRAGRAPVTYADPALEPILSRTLGIALFQEQVLRIAMVLAGFTASEAEDLRRALGFHRNNERMERSLGRLRERLGQRGYGPEVVDDLSRQIRSFALYGFPESHAISFALIAYASCWLKVHRPAEFLAALLNNQPMGFYSPATLVQDARRRGLVVRPPCLQRSAWETVVEDDRTIRLGLGLLRGLRRSAYFAWRAAGADPNQLDGFNASERRLLAAVGALNLRHGHRRAALWVVEDRMQRSTAGTQQELDLAGALPQAPAPLTAMSLLERVSADFACSGLTAGDHPLARLREQLPGVWRACDLQLGVSGDLVRVAGAVICRQRPGTAKGVVFVSLEDETGICNVICHSRFFEENRLLITQEPFLEFDGRLQTRDGVCHVLASAARRPAALAAALPAEASHDFR